MRVNTVEITNAQSIKDGALTGLGQMNILVGPNGAGKSIVFRALSLFVQLLRPGDPNFFQQVANQQYVIRSNTVNAPGFANKYVTPATPPTIYIQIQVEPADGAILKTVGYNNQIDRSVRVGFGIRHVGNAELWRLEADDEVLIRDGARIAADLPKINATLTLLKSIFLSWKFVFVPAFRTLEPEAIGVTFAPDPSGKSLKRYIHFLENGTSEQRALIDDIKRAFEAVTGMTWSFRTWTRDQQPDGMPLLVRDLQDLSKEFVVEQSGDGWQELVILLTAVFSAPRGALVAIEEPELHLHPGAQRRLFSLLMDRGRFNQFIVSTHSPTLLERSAELPVFHASRHTDGTSTIVRASEGGWYSDIVSSLGLRRSDAFLARGVLFVEGTADAEILRAWGMASGCDLEESGVVLHAVGGKRNMEYIAEADAIRASGGPLGGIPCAFFRDRDELSPQEASRLVDTLKPYGPCFILGRREIENYLLEPSVIATVLNSVPERAHEKAVTADDVRSALLAISRGYMGFLMIRRLTDGIGRSPHGSAVLKQLDGVDLVADEAVANAAAALVDGPFMDRSRIVAEIRTRLPKVRSEIASYDESQWLIEAPGSRVLEDTFRKFGASYRLAQVARMVTPDQTVIEFLRSFKAACMQS